VPALPPAHYWLLQRRRGAADELAAMIRARVWRP
jgi:hypothetical protein